MEETTKPKNTKSTLIDGVILEIYGFKIKENSLYEIQEKLDSSAPDGFVDYRTSKLLNIDVEDGCPGAVFSMKRGVWDTGLYESSTALKEAFGTEIDSVIEKIQDYIVKPYEKEKGEGVLNHLVTNNLFWDNFRIPLKRGKVFNTANIDDLLQLYLCLVHKRLTPKDLESHPAFKQPISYYLIVDKEANIGREAEKEMIRMKATAVFYAMLSSNKDGLFQILDFLGIQANEKTDEPTLVRVFNAYIDNKTDKFQNDGLFIKAVDEFNTEKGKEVFFIHSKLKELYKSGKGVTFKSGVVSIDGMYVENGWKNSARKIQEDTELMETFQSMLE